MSPFCNNDDEYDPFAWLKTTAWIVLLFAVMIASTVRLAHAADQCTTACRDRHNQCRVSTRGAASCDVALQQCVQSCVASQSKK